MQIPSSILFHFIFLIVVFLIVMVIVLRIAAKNVFHGSGKPELMADSINSMTRLMSQSLIAVLIIGTLLVLMGEKIVEGKEGLPIISGIAGYILGQSGKNNSSQA